MSTIVTRTGKGSPLTTAEMDANFTNLNNDKVQVTGTPSSGQAVVWNGSAWVPGAAGATITDDTSTNSSFYIGLSSATTGAWTSAYTSSTKLYYNPSTGTLNSTTFNSLSDANLKTNVETVQNASDTISKMRGVSFDWVDNGNKSYGVIAQEIEQVVPELVSTNEYGEKSVNYLSIIAFLIESNKELQARIETLENQ